MLEGNVEGVLNNICEFVLSWLSIMQKNSFISLYLKVAPPPLINSQHRPTTTRRAMSDGERLAIKLQFMANCPYSRLQKIFSNLLYIIENLSLNMKPTSNNYKNFRNKIDLFFNILNG